mgnify:CR=1 FL=1
MADGGLFGHYLHSGAGRRQPELKEAAIVDGASRLQRIWHVDLPAIRPTVVTMLIFACGNMINIGFDKVFLMQNSMNLANPKLSPPSYIRSAW